LFSIRHWNHFSWTILLKSLMVILFLVSLKPIVKLGQSGWIQMILEVSYHLQFFLLVIVFHNYVLSKALPLFCISRFLCNSSTAVIGAMLGIRNGIGIRKRFSNIKYSTFYSILCTPYPFRIGIDIREGISFMFDISLTFFFLFLWTLLSIFELLTIRCSDLVWCGVVLWDLWCYFFLSLGFPFGILYYYDRT